jgi:hypothetical protein
LLTGWVLVNVAEGAGVAVWVGAFVGGTGVAGATVAVAAGGSVAVAAVVTVGAVVAVAPGAPQAARSEAVRIIHTSCRLI